MSNTTTRNMTMRRGGVRLAVAGAIAALGLASAIPAARPAQADEIVRTYEWHGGRQVLVERRYVTPPPLVVYEAPPRVIYEAPPPRIVYEAPPVVVTPPPPATYVAPPPATYVPPPPVTYIPPPPVTVITR